MGKIKEEKDITPGIVNAIWVVMAAMILVLGLFVYDYWKAKKEKETDQKIEQESIQYPWAKTTNDMEGN